MRATGSTSSSNGPSPRASIFAAKTGFLIPKNKLSGSLVPIFRPAGGTATGSGPGAAPNENTKQLHRKTRWAPDPSQDSAVRKARALAYQTRVDQITLLLRSENLNAGDNQHTLTTAHHADDESSSIKNDSKKSELLEIEKAEAIGEILRLNSSYKAPHDYKPLLKEATVPIPVKEYPGYNFFALLFGPGGDTQKQLEKDTGAKIRVYGIKDQITGQKVDISSPDGHEFQGTYEELYVCVTAETFDKVDSAVALIELLIHSISGNLGAGSISTAVSGDTVNIQTQAQDLIPPYTIDNAAINDGLPQSSQASAEGHMQHQGPWFQSTAPSQNLPGPIVRSPVPPQSSPLTMPSIFGPGPALAAVYNSVQNLSFIPGSSQPSSQVLSQPSVPQIHPQGHAGLPRNFCMATPNTSLAQPNISLAVPSANQALSVGSLPVTRPLMPLLPPAAAGSSMGWSGVPAVLGPSSHGTLAPQAIPAQVSHPMVAGGAAPAPGACSSNVSGTFQTAQSGLQLNTTPINHPAPTAFPVVPFYPVPSVSLRSTLSMPATQSSALGAPAQIPSVNPGRGLVPIFSPVASASPQLPPQVQVLGPGPVGTAGSTLKLQHASSDDFTFHPRQPQNPGSSMVLRPGFSQQSLQGASTRPMVQLQAPQDSQFHFIGHNSTFQAGIQVFAGPQVGNQIGRPSSHVPSSAYACNSFGMSAPPRHPVLPNPIPVTCTPPASQPGFRGSGKASQFPNLPGHFPPMLQQHCPDMPSWPGKYMHASTQWPFTRPGFNQPGGRQSYDPFSPSSVTMGPQQQGGGQAMVTKQESDPEYEDLMASVGVK